MLKKKIMMIVTIVVSLSVAMVCYASDYSSYSQEELRAEIERLENELEILYGLLEQETDKPKETDESDRTKVFEYTGSGDSVVSLDDYGDWFMFEIDGNYGGNYFGVIAYDEDGNRLGSLVNTTDVYHGRVYENTQSVKTLEVKASGDWTIKEISLYTAHYGVKGDTLKGNGDDVIVFFTDKGSSTTASITGNSGADYFGVIGYDGTGKRTGALVNTTDVYSGTVMLKNNPRIFEVKATGEWTITFE